MHLSYYRLLKLHEWQVDVNMKCIEQFDTEENLNIYRHIH